MSDNNISTSAPRDAQWREELRQGNSCQGTHITPACQNAGTWPGIPSNMQWRGQPGTAGRSAV